MSEVDLTISVGAPREPSSLRLVLTLALAGMLSGFTLASVYQVTKPVIDANKAERLRAGVFRVVPGSTSLQALALLDDRLVPVTEEQRIPPEDTIYGAYDDAGRFLGYAIVGDGPGFQDTIRVLYGYDPVRGRVIGMQILESRETPGLGDKIYKDDDFVANFDDLAAEPEIEVVTDGRDAEHEVDAITGATISSRAVVRIINAANRRWRPDLPPPGAEPALAAPADVSPVEAGAPDEPTGGTD